MAHACFKLLALFHVLTLEMQKLKALNTIALLNVVHPHCLCSPSVLLPAREEMLDFMFKCHQVVEMIMESFARGLGLAEDFFKNVSRCRHPIGSSLSFTMPR